jgi:hypothetical protein
VAAFPHYSRQGSSFILTHDSTVIWHCRLEILGLAKLRRGYEITNNQHSEEGHRVQLTIAVTNNYLVRAEQNASNSYLSPLKSARSRRAPFGNPPEFLLWVITKETPSGKMFKWA